MQLSITDYKPIVLYSFKEKRQDLVLTCSPCSPGWPGDPSEPFPPWKEKKKSE